MSQLAKFRKCLSRTFRPAKQQEPLPPDGERKSDPAKPNTAEANPISSQAVIMDRTEAFCVHEVSEAGQTCNICFHLDFQGDRDNPMDLGLYAAQVIIEWESRTPMLAEPGTSLCERCQSMTLGEVCSTEGYIHSLCYWALSTSAKISKCPMCVIMVNTLRGPRGEGFEYGLTVENPYQNNRWVRVRAVPKERRQQMNNLEVEIMNRNWMLNVVRPGLLSMVMAFGAKAAEYGIRPKQPFDDSQKFNAMAQWLDSQRMHNSYLQPTMPTRVLDLDPTRGEIRLVETIDLSSQCEPYMALSYRWGSPENNHLMTTLETLGDRKEGMRLVDMPKTIQDSVAVTRKLNIRYLWIDALCIIQDSPADWKQEARNMGAIYMNATCTIAAHSANHAHHGFLEKSMKQPQAIRLGGNGLDAENSFWVSQTGLQRSQIVESELSSRGWVVQERILSKSTIHFANDGIIYLESTSEMMSLDGAKDATPLEAGGIRSMIVKDLSRGNIPDEEMKKISAKVYRDWYVLVWLYTQCSLTKPDDKIPALTGIINQIHEFTRDRCFMGVWQRQPTQGLLWGRSQRAFKRAIPFRGPSWSWTAYDGLVGFPNWTGDDQEMQDEFAAVEFDHSDDPLGVLSGLPKLRILRAKMLRDFSFTTLNPRGGTGLRFLHGQVGDPSTINCILWRPLKCFTRFWQVGDDSGDKVGWATFDEEKAGNFDGEDEHITCIAIASHSTEREGWKRGYMVLFMKLLESGCFERVGMGQIDKSELFDRLPVRDVTII